MFTKKVERLLLDLRLLSNIQKKHKVGRLCGAGVFTEGHAQTKKVQELNPAPFDFKTFAFELYYLE